MSTSVAPNPASIGVADMDLSQEGSSTGVGVGGVKSASEEEKKAAETTTLPKSTVKEGSEVEVGAGATSIVKTQTMAAYTTADALFASLVRLKADNFAISGTPRSARGEEASEQAMVE